MSIPTTSTPGDYHLLLTLSVLLHVFNFGLAIAVVLTRENVDPFAHMDSGCQFQLVLRTTLTLFLRIRRGPVLIWQFLEPESIPIIVQTVETTI